MDLISRLKNYMDHLGMSSSVFADTAQIPRPTLSQILSGRNKKISNEVIAKLHAAFPSLNVMWLMFGDGEMEVAGNIAFSEPQNQQNSANAPSQTTKSEVVTPQLSLESIDQNFIQSINQTASTPQKTANEAPNISNAHKTHASSPSQQPSVHEMLVNGIGQSRFLRDNEKGATDPMQAAGSRRIESIMVFYTDNSFEVFRPAE